MHFDPSKNVRSWRCKILCGFIAIGSIFYNTPPEAAQDLTPVQSQIVPADALIGGVEWINTKSPIQLEQLRGKFVLLDFWTYCCINCLQTLPDLKKIEQAYPNQLVVIGVHAPKFFGERDSENVREAVLRHDISHPVVNDANAIIARSFQVSGWPSLRLIDPQGNLIASHYGEITFESLNAFMKRVVPKYRKNRLLDETPLRFPMERTTTTPTGLRFPGKVLADSETQRLFVADSGHHRIVILSLQGQWLDTIGSGQAGFEDGEFAVARFSNPQGMALHGDMLYVADTDNHALRQVDLNKKLVKTVAGSGQQAFTNPTFRVSNQPTAIRLASPWDLLVHEQSLYVAMAGTHQIWRLTLDRPRLNVFAGNGVEDIVNGPLLSRVGSTERSASFAQPTGLTSDSRRLFVADSEGSSIRIVPLNEKGDVRTLIGTSSLSAPLRLFTFGDRDGPLSEALLQHPLGVAYASGKLFIADSYNNKIKEVDFNSRKVQTIAGSDREGKGSDTMPLNEPGGLSIANGVLYVADTNNHVIRTLEILAP
ncbi:MAG: thioredoxin-like domain-containing protein, partial [Planctomycetota bacterium]|nr:thioredoxin-like domain-containing protein [Planctomycetota bacterium]